MSILTVITLVVVKIQFIVLHNNKAYTFEQKVVKTNQTGNMNYKDKNLVKNTDICHHTSVVVHIFTAQNYINYIYRNYYGSAY